MARCSRPLRPAARRCNSVQWRACAQHVGQRQHAQTGGGQAGRAGAAVQQRRAQPGFQVAQLVRQGGLGQVQPFGGFLQAAAIADGGQGFQVTNFQHGGVQTKKGAERMRGRRADGRRNQLSHGRLMCLYFMRFSHIMNVDIDFDSN